MFHCTIEFNLTSSHILVDFQLPPTLPIFRWRTEQHSLIKGHCNRMFNITGTDHISKKRLMFTKKVSVSTHICRVGLKRYIAWKIIKSSCLTPNAGGIWSWQLIYLFMLSVPNSFISDASKLSQDVDLRDAEHWQSGVFGPGMWLCVLLYNQFPNSPWLQKRLE